MAQAADEWRARWRTALALYEQAKYDKACQLLRAVSKEQPKNALVWADVAACETKLSGASSARALHAARMSIRWGDESTREKGYLVLGAAAQRLALPSNGCATLSAPREAACARKVIACAKSWNSAGSAYSTDGEVVFFGYTRAQAEAQGDDFDPRVENAFDNVLSLNDHAEETCGASCDRAVQAGAAAESPLIIKQAQACVQRRPGPFGSNEPCLWQGQRCGDEPSCRATVLKNAAKISAIAAEVQHFISKCISDCQANAKPAGPSCSVVHADGCQGNIGVVCTQKNADGSERTEASEWGIPEPD
ncbi:MAG TPA: hypothetical protein VJV79_24355 [Polyangiaceae bacterium]|nr:hypothetical protein [Polyangiaceae bacterium]